MFNKYKLVVYGTGFRNSGPQALTKLVKWFTIYIALWHKDVHMHVYNILKRSRSCSLMEAQEQDTNHSLNLTLDAFIIIIFVSCALDIHLRHVYWLEVLNFVVCLSSYCLPAVTKSNYSILWKIINVPGCWETIFEYLVFYRVS